MKGDWGKHFRIQGSYGNFETVVHIHVSPAHEYPRKQTKHPQYLDYEELKMVQCTTGMQRMLN